MDILEIVERMPNKSYFTGITSNMKELRLSYVITDNYDEYLDMLDDKYNIYTYVESFYLETDFIYELPKNVSKFGKLLKIQVCGSRWWDLDMTFIPKSIKHVTFTEQSNLSEKCLNGCETLINLETLELSDIYDITARIDEYYYVFDDNQLCIPFIPSLKQINIELNSCRYELELKENFRKILLDMVLFKNYDINSIYYEEDIYTLLIDVKPKV